MLLKVRLYGGRLADAHKRTQTHTDARRCTQTNADERRQTQTHADERKANCFRCVGGRNLKMRPDVRHLFKDFQDVLYICLYLHADKDVGEFRASPELRSHQHDTAEQITR